MIASREQQKLAARKRAERSTQPTVERPRILVIEDNPHDWEIYGKILWYNGFDVSYARDGAEGLRRAAAERPDLVLLDLGLPDVEGLDLCRELNRLGGTKVLILSARPRREYESRAIEAGCVSYLEKPIGPTQVLREVEELVGRPPLPGEGRPPELSSGRS